MDKQMYWLKIFVLESGNSYVHNINNGLKELGWSNLFYYSKLDELIKNLHQLPDVVILNYNLLQDKKIIRQITDENPNCKIIVHSDMQIKKLLLELINSGVYDYVTHEKNMAKQLHLRLSEIGFLQINYQNSRRLKRMWHSLYLSIAALSIIGLLILFDYVNTFL